MEQPPTQAGPADPAATPHSSIAAKLLNIIAVPSDVFAEIKAAPVSAANWLIPVLLASIIGVLTCLIVFSQPNVQQQLREQQAKAMDVKVKAGKMSQADEDRALEFMGPKFLKITGSIGGFVISFFRLFWWALILWLFGRWFLHTNFGYRKGMEIAGLAVMVSCVGSTVALLLQMNIDRLMVTPSGTLFIQEFDISKKTHWFLAVLNPFYFWQIVVMALGVARLAGAPFWRAALPIMAFWVIQESALIAAGLGQFAM